MAWKTPKTNWAANDVLGPNDFNRIEGNTLDNHERLNGHSSDGTQHKKTVRFVIGTSTAGWTEKDCDYLCDGTADQIEINNAINALPATGGEVVILDGTYNITARIHVNKDNVSIRGSGNATILKRLWNSTSTEGVISLTSVEGCRVENLQIDGNNTTYTSNYNYGIHLNSSSNNAITGNTCNNNEHGIHLESSNNNAITGNTCNNNEHGIRLESSNNNAITGNSCNNNGDNGIRLYLSSDNTITGNTCYNNDSTIYLSTSSNNIVTSNTCNNSSNGILLYLSTNNTITGNTCSNNNNGIRLSASSNNIVTSNTCIRGTGTPEDYSTNQYTIYLTGMDTKYNLITSNNCMGKAPVVQGGTGNTVFNNKWDASNDIDVSDIPGLVGTNLALGRGALAEVSSVALGYGASATGTSSIALGENASATRGYSLALGLNASATGLYSVALGENASAPGDYSLALGREASATGDYSVALGENASAPGNYSVALGNDAWAGHYSVALGGEASTENYSVALGYDASAAFASVALGREASATGDYSVALGYNASAENANEGILGNTGVYETSKWKVPGSFTVSGTKNFEIPHPKPEKSATHVIRHGAVESPTPGDTLYRWRVQANKDNDLVTIDLPDYFIYLNKDVQIWVTGQGHFGNGYGTLNRETEQLEIHCQLAGEYNVLVIGTRNDDHQSVRDWYIKGVEREIGESWIGETYAFSVNEIIEMEEIKEVSA